MTNGAHGGSRWSYPGTLAMLALAVAFPIALMVFNPTLMFERGWEQFVGTGIYFWAVFTLCRELFRLRQNERAFEEAPAYLQHMTASAGRPSGQKHRVTASWVSEGDQRVLPIRARQLGRYIEEAHSPSVAQLMELNREGSALDQEHYAGRFTLPRYILYLLPVIGFIGTVEGISKALMNISKVLPMVKNLDGFMSNLTSVTSALQVAFDSTLLALFLSAALMLVQTLVYRRAEDLLARVDRWVVDQVLPRVGGGDPVAAGIAVVLGEHLEKLRGDLAAAIEPAARGFELQAERWSAGLGVQIERFGESVDRLPASFTDFQRGAQAIGAAGESLRQGVGSLGRIESSLAHGAATDQRLDEIQRGIDRTCAAIESLATSWSQAYERSSRATQDQLARTLGSLKDALDMLNVSMEQSNALYRSIVKKMLPTFHTIRPDEEAA